MYQKKAPALNKLTLFTNGHDFFVTNSAVLFSLYLITASENNIFKIFLTFDLLAMSSPVSS